ncbi:hypothetical protein C1645_808645, partial [Glomus cerebriforme]
MPKKLSQKSNSQFNSPITKISTKKGQQTPIKTFQQKTSTPKNKNNKPLISTNPENILKLNDKFFNNSNLNDSENEQEFNKDESGGEDEDIVMQDIKSLTTSEEEEASTDSSDEENTKQLSYSEEELDEENSNEENEDEKESDEEMNENYNEIIEDISLKKKQKEKEEIKNQDKTMSKESTEIKDPIPTPLLARSRAEKQFRDYYMNQITKAFGEDLDKLRKMEVNLSSNKLEILIDSLESGISIFSDVE